MTPLPIPRNHARPRKQAIHAFQHPPRSLKVEAVNDRNQEQIHTSVKVETVQSDGAERERFQERAGNRIQWPRRRCPMRCS